MTDKLGVSYGFNSRAWMQKPGLCLGGESVTVNLSSLRSLHERGIIEEAPKQSGDAFWLTRYRLKEPQS